ncbi:MAG: sulfatase-like hydrolase/transferase, partial [Flavobacteriaceae bacterium]
MKKIIQLVVILLLTTACESKKKVSTSAPNILFIAVDDLRPELGIYGNPIVKSPNIDQLAREGSFFSRHYVHVPTCGASRYSLMTGLRPRKRIHLDNRVFYREM